MRLAFSVLLGRTSSADGSSRLAVVLCNLHVRVASRSVLSPPSVSSLVSYCLS